MSNWLTNLFSGANLAPTIVNSLYSLESIKDSLFMSFAFIIVTLDVYDHTTFSTSPVLAPLYQWIPLIYTDTSLAYFCAIPITLIMTASSFLTHGSFDQLDITELATYLILGFIRITATVVPDSLEVLLMNDSSLLTAAQGNWLYYAATLSILGVTKAASALTLAGNLYIGYVLYSAELASGNFSVNYIVDTIAVMLLALNAVFFVAPSLTTYIAFIL